MLAGVEGTNGNLDFEISPYYRYLTTGWLQTSRQCRTIIYYPKQLTGPAIAVALNRDRNVLLDKELIIIQKRMTSNICAARGRGQDCGILEKLLR